MRTSNPALSLKEAADRLGVHYMTVYRYVRLGMLPARREGSVWRVDSSDLERLNTKSEIPARKRATPWGERLLARMLVGDETGSWGLVEAAIGSGMDPGNFYCDVLTPALHSMGERWRAGKLGIDQEHLASNVAAGIIGKLSVRFGRPGRRKGTVAVALPEGEHHQFGAAMLADILRSDGYRVLNFGADNPPASLLSALQEVDDLLAVAVGVVYTQHFDAAKTLIKGARQSLQGVTVVAGGAAIPNKETAQRLGADGWASSARQAGGVISELAAVRGRARMVPPT